MTRVETVSCVSGQSVDHRLSKEARAQPRKKKKEKRTGIANNVVIISQPASSRAQEARSEKSSLREFGAARVGSAALDATKTGESINQPVSHTRYNTQPERSEATQAIASARQQDLFSFGRLFSLVGRLDSGRGQFLKPASPRLSLSFALHYHERPKSGLLSAAATSS